MGPRAPPCARAAPTADRLTLALPRHLACLPRRCYIPRRRRPRRPPPPLVSPQPGPPAPAPPPSELPHPPTPAAPPRPPLDAPPAASPPPLHWRWRRTPSSPRRPAPLPRVAARRAAEQPYSPPCPSPSSPLPRRASAPPTTRSPPMAPPPPRRRTLLHAALVLHAALGSARPNAANEPQAEQRATVFASCHSARATCAAASRPCAAREGRRSSRSPRARRLDALPACHHRQGGHFVVCRRKTKTACLASFPPCGRRSRPPLRSSAAGRS